MWLLLKTMALITFAGALLTLAGTVVVARFYEINRNSIFERAGAGRLTVLPEAHFGRPFDAPVEQGMWLDLEDASELRIQAIILREDRAFRKHIGVNPKFLARVVAELASSLVKPDNTIVTGSSTITMQVARILYVGQHRRGEKILGPMAGFHL